MKNLSFIKKAIKNPTKALYYLRKGILRYIAQDLAWHDIYHEIFGYSETTRKVNHLGIYKQDICLNTSNTLVNFIYGFCKSFRYNTFLEIGTYKGYTSLSIHKLFMKEFKKSVVHTLDPEIWNRKLLDYKGTKNHVFRFFNQKSDDYFKVHDEKFDFILIDGDHSYEAVKKDFRNSVKVLNKNGVILLHDPVSCKGVCKFFVEHVQNNKDYNHLIFPYHVGYILVQKNDDPRFEKFLKRHPNKHVKDVKFIDLNHYVREELLKHRWLENHI